MTASGVFERFPKLKFIGSEVHAGWVPYFMEKWDESVRRNRAEWTQPLLPSEYINRNVWFVYTVDEMGLENRYSIGVDRLMWGPDFPHSSSCWPLDYQVGREVLERSGATEAEIERIMWKTCADVFKLPYDEPAKLSQAA
jgi:predicted TIM-barrel fold metal-dependent hydrolase